MCVDSPVKPDDMQGPPVGVWPCHNSGGNQVLKKHESFIENPFVEVVGLISYLWRSWYFNPIGFKGIILTKL